MPSMKSYLRSAQLLAVVAERARTSWAQRGLSCQFTVATSAIMIVGMLTVGHWVAGRVERCGHPQQRGCGRALRRQFHRVAGPGPRLPIQTDSSKRAGVGRSTVAAGRRPAGRRFQDLERRPIVYSDRRELNGRTFPPSSLRQRAWSGHVAAEYGHLDDPSHAPLGASQPILDIRRYERRGRAASSRSPRPIRSRLPCAMNSPRPELATGSWSRSSLSMLFLQSIIVRGGSRTIREQRASLAQQIAELSRLLRENDALRQRANQANSRVAEMNERCYAGSGLICTTVRSS